MARRPQSIHRLVEHDPGATHRRCDHGPGDQRGAVAAADPHYDGDVPGMNYQASLGAPCDNYEHFIFGRGPSGQAEACHFPPPNQFPAATTGYWVISYPLYGVQQTGAPCPGSQSAAQTPDGLPMLCLGAKAGSPAGSPGPGSSRPPPDD